MKDLNSLREKIRDIDDQIMDLVKQRMQVASDIGQIKLEKQLPIKDFRVEKHVIENAKKRAKEFDLYEELAIDLLQLLISYSVKAQDEYHSTSVKRQTETEEKILIVGGCGRMGMWLTDFFQSFGHEVWHFDQHAKTGGISRITSLDQIDDFSIICLATPISATAGMLVELTQRRFKGLIFDICSLKSPIIEHLSNALKQGLKISSIHPMFGPDVSLLAGRNILICDLGQPETLAQAQKLFANTTANVLTVPIAKHDEYMGYVLGLSHLINLLFADVIQDSNIPFHEILKTASSTFNSQQNVTLPVINESQDLYYEIQVENDFTPKLIEKIDQSLKKFSHAILNKDRDEFKKLMQSSKDYFKS